MRTDRELLIECVTQLKHIDEIYGFEPLATTTSLIREVSQALNIPVVTHRAWIVEYTIDDSDVLQFNVADAPNQLAAKAVAVYGLPRKAKLLNCSPVLHGG